MKNLKKETEKRVDWKHKWKTISARINSTYPLVIARSLLIGRPFNEARRYRSTHRHGRQKLKATALIETLLCQVETLDPIPLPADIERKF